MQMTGFFWYHAVEALLLAHLGSYLILLAQVLRGWQALPGLSDVTPEQGQNQGAGADTELVDIVIPARNEARKIGRCLDSLLGQTFQAFRVWMVNDRSTDATGDIMAQAAQADPRFRVIQGQEPPPGWAGKVNAIMQAVPHLSAPWVLFLDADTALHPQTLARAVALARQNRLQMLSLIPDLECKSFWEQVILPAMVLLISLRYPAHRVNNPDRPGDAIANGQFILIRREVYERLGTHRAVYNSLVEDLDFARLAKSQGVRYWLASGLDYFRVRMYTSFGEIREGWTKNIYFAQPDRWAVATLARMALIAWMGLMPWLGLLAGWLLPGQTGLLVPLSWVALGVMTGVIALNRLLYRSNPWYALLHPLGLLVIAGFMWESRQLALSAKGVAWKGRHYRASAHTTE